MIDIPKDILNQIKSIPGCDGVVFTGSRQQGTATKESDWDFYILLKDGNKSFRKTWAYGDAFIEVFCNTMKSIEKNELVVDRISNAAIRMLATGTIIFDESGILSEVQSRAKNLYLAGPPSLADDQKMLIAYSLRNYIDDLKSLPELNSDGFYLQSTALIYAVESFYRLEGRWMAKPRSIEEDVSSIDPEWSSVYSKANKVSGPEKSKSIIRLIELLSSKHKLELTGEVFQIRKSD